MQRMRDQHAAKAARQQVAGTESEDTSRANTLTPQEEAEEEAHMEEPRFQEMKTEKETEDADGLKRVHTGRSTRSRRTVRDLEFDSNPFDIDRVNTRESFAGRPRGNSRASTKR